MLLKCDDGEWTARSNQSILMEISPKYSLKGLIPKLKLQYLGHLMQRNDSLEKTLNAVKDWRQEENWMTEDKMVGWHYWLDGHEFEQAPGQVMDREACRAVVYGVTNSHTWLSDWTELYDSHFYVESKKVKLMELESRTIVTRGQEMGKWDILVKVHEHWIIRWVSSRHSIKHGD